MDVPSSESDAFMRVAEVAGLELPATITEQIARLESLAAEKASLPQPEKVPPKATLLANGVPMDKVTEHARLTCEARELAELHEAAWYARARAPLGA